MQVTVMHAEGQAEPFTVYAIDHEQRRRAIFGRALMQNNAIVKLVWTD